MKNFAALVLVATLTAACSIPRPPQPPIPTPTPPPAPGTGVVNANMLLHRDMSQLMHVDGNGFDFRGAIACCNTESGEPNPKWPLASTEWMDYLITHGNINIFHIRLGGWRTVPGGEEEWASTGGAYLEVGGKADLTKWNPAFWTAVDNILTSAANRNMWVEVDLIDGWGIKHCQWGDLGAYHPWQASNNVQGENHCRADFDAVQEAFVRKAASVVGRHGNVVLQTSNEGGQVSGWTELWENAIIAAFHDEEVKRSFPRHLIASNAERPVSGADWNEWHSGGGPVDRGPKITGVNEYNPEPPLSGATQAGNYCSARTNGVYYWLWRHGMTKAEWETSLSLVKSGCTSTVACPHPDFNSTQWFEVQRSGTTGPDVVQAGEEVRAAHPEWFNGAGCVSPLDDDHANILKVLDASAAQYRADGRCGWPEHDAIMAARLDGCWDENHLIAYGSGCFLLPGNVVKHVWCLP